jgi:hypothetical protein
MAQMLGDTLKLVRDKLDSSKSKRDIAYDITLTLHGLEHYPTVGVLFVKVRLYNRSTHLITTEQPSIVHRALPTLSN